MWLLHYIDIILSFIWYYNTYQNVNLKPMPVRIYLIYNNIIHHFIEN